MKKKNKDSILIALFVIGIFLVGGVANAFFSPDAVLYRQSIFKPTPSPTVTTKLNTCYKSDGTSFKTTADCVEFKNTPTPTTKPKQKAKAVVSQIDCTGPDGVVFKTTKVECDKFNSAWDNDSKKPLSNTTVKKQEYDSYDYEYTGTNNPPCTLYYKYSGVSRTYNTLTASECIDEQNRIDDSVAGFETTTTTTNTTETTQDNSVLQSECLDDAVTAYNKAVQTANVRYGGGNSLGDLMRNEAQNDYNDSVSYCKSAYPI